jgi:hypothetical protein
MRMLHRCAALLSCLATNFVTARSPAAPSPQARTSSLAWVRSEGAEGCIGGKELAEAVEGQLGRKVFVSASAGEVAVEGRVDKAADGAGWRATIRISDEHGTVVGSREISSPETDCRRMDESLAFVVAVMIDPEASSRPHPLRPEPAGAPPRPSNRWELAPSAGIAATLGQLPDAAWGPTARLRFGPPRVGVELSGVFFVPQEQAVAGVAAARLHEAWGYGGVALCPRLARTAAVSVSACGGVAAGILSVNASGLAVEQPVTSVIVLLTAAGRLQWAVVGHLFLGVDVGATAPMSRPSFAVAVAPAPAPAVVLARPSLVAGVGGLCLGFSIE